MKKMILTLIITFIFQYLFAPGNDCALIFRTEPIAPYEKLILAIVQVESNGDRYAFNPTEKACGAFQIRDCRLNEYNAKTGLKMRLKDMYDYDKAKQVFLYFTDGRDYETIARAWSGGEHGTKKATNNYWSKVKQELNR
jgi:hypothetical protein